jgi:hypothetical protein
VFSLACLIIGIIFLCVGGFTGAHTAGLILIIVGGVFFGLRLLTTWANGPLP